ncbi:hypothetical protein FB451DRAFT_1172512 [Mycena latifolia]|nr:hypothetical protein FB451DRAFT_1172512 [Mycena latifolia]
MGVEDLRHIAGDIVESAPVDVGTVESEGHGGLREGEAEAPVLSDSNAAAPGQCENTKKPTLGGRPSITNDFMKTLDKCQILLEKGPVSLLLRKDGLCVGTVAIESGAAGPRNGAQNLSARSLEGCMQTSSLGSGEFRFAEMRWLNLERKARLANNLIPARQCSSGSNGARGHALGLFHLAHIVDLPPRTDGTRLPCTHRGCLPYMSCARVERSIDKSSPSPSLPLLPRSQHPQLAELPPPQDSASLFQGGWVWILRLLLSGASQSSHFPSPNLVSKVYFRTLGGSASLKGGAFNVRFKQPDLSFVLLQSMQLCWVYLDELDCPQKLTYQGDFLEIWQARRTLSHSQLPYFKEV